MMLLYIKILDLRKSYLKKRVYKYRNKLLELKKRNVENYYQFSTESGQFLI